MQAQASSSHMPQNTSAQYERKRYESYYHQRKLDPNSQGWTSWAVGNAAKGFFYLGMAQSFVAEGVSIVLASTVTKKVVSSTVVETVAGKCHEAFTASTRVPVSHERVDNAVTILNGMRHTYKIEGFIRELQTLYTAGYTSSHGSYKLMEIITGCASVNAKIDSLIEYLGKKVTKVPDFTDLYYHNGKELYQKIVWLTEKQEFRNY